MKAHDLKGKRIERIEQTRNVETNGGPVTSFDRIVLEDGTILYPSVHETDGEYVVEMKRLDP